MHLVANAWAWTACVLIVLFGWIPVGAVWLVTAPVDPGRYWAGRAFRRLAVLAVQLNPLWKFRTSGVPVRDPRRPYVVVSNHESYADIFLISHLPWEMKWLSKDTIFRIPLMGWMMRMAGDIPVTRGKASSRMAALDGCRDRLKKRVSVMFFPEGTRSKRGEMLPFYDGAFRLAVESGCPILPIAVAGTTHAMAKGSFRFMPAIAEARVLPPVETAGLGLGDVPALRERVRVLIDAARRELWREMGIEGEYAGAGAPLALQPTPTADIEGETVGSASAIGTDGDGPRDDAA
jgi:1-acyl-sn-glycerol-3-phosphate acyltransferase